MLHPLDTTSIQISSQMPNIKQGSTVMTEGFPDIEGRITNDIWSFIPMLLSLVQCMVSLHITACTGLIQVRNLYLKNMYVLSQMLPMPKVTL